MNNLFINPEDTITVTIFVGQVDNKIVAASKKDDLKKENKDVDLESVESYQVSFRRTNYKDNVDIMKMTMTTDGESLKADIATLRYERFVNLVKGWSFKDENGNVIPANRENIDKLHGSVADAILNAFDEALDSL